MISVFVALENFPSTFIKDKHLHEHSIGLSRISNINPAIFMNIAWFNYFRKKIHSVNLSDLSCFDNQEFPKLTRMLYDNVTYILEIEIKHD